jgi:signal transduction histidine kinase
MDNALLDRLILYVLCTSVYLLRVDGYYAVVPILAAVVADTFCDYFKNVRVKLCCFAGFVVLCFFKPQFILFLPVLSYDLPIPQWWWLLLNLLPVCAVISQGHVADGIFTLLFILLGMLMKYRTVTFEKTQSDYISLRDTTKELSMRLSDKNKELRDKQDYEVNVATLNERNRIACDIHDSVGHLLSSAILQVGALMAACPDEAMKTGLGTVKDTLSQGMDSVRTSVHQLYDESIDLYTEIRTIVRNFTFCPVTLDYTVESDPDRNIKYAFIAVVKEALSNVMRHSNATSVCITLREHPALYQLVIKDNGNNTKQCKILDGGIGLANIADRISALGGILNINEKSGFILFISVPKGA